MSESSKYNLKNYRYDLPKRLIAQFPAQNRAHSRMLIVDKLAGTWRHASFEDFPMRCTAQDTVVANSSRVIPARFLGIRKGTGGKIEFFLLKKITPDGLMWRGLMRSTAAQKLGMEMEFGRSRSGQSLQAVVVQNDVLEGIVEAQFTENPLDSGLGQIPLPPYIERDESVNENDSARYQTVYAQDPGSVAAPTAGLHFTSEIIQTLKNKNVHWSEISLHVGVGTFRPIKCDDIRNHKMHQEDYFISDAVAQQLNQDIEQKRRITCIGTTSLRCIESAWDVAQGKFKSGFQATSLFLYPESQTPLLSVTHRLLTNFHLPESSLFILVCALLGRDLALSVYEEAIREEYRFFSYGDCMLIEGI